MWYFTFMFKDEGKRDYIVKINEKQYNVARKIMFDLFGVEWAFQYDEKEGEQIIKDYGYKIIDVSV